MMQMEWFWGENGNFHTERHLPLHSTHKQLHTLGTNSHIVTTLHNNTRHSSTKYVLGATVYSRPIKCEFQKYNHTFNDSRNIKLSYTCTVYCVYRLTENFSGNYI